MYPLTLRDWETWDVSATEFEPHYPRIAEAVGIAGRPDAIDDFYGTSYVNRPAAPCSALNESLISAVNSRTRQQGATILAGVNRLAVELEKVMTKLALVAANACTAASGNPFFALAKLFAPWSQTDDSSIAAPQSTESSQGHVVADCSLAMAMPEFTITSSCVLEQTGRPRSYCEALASPATR